MRKRGFTLIELMIVVVILPVILGAVGAYYLESRVAAARIEAQASLTRNLAVVHELIAKDLRSATKTEPTERGVRIYIQDERLDYELLNDGLVRITGGEKGSEQTLSSAIKALKIEDQKEGFLVTLKAERKLLPKRRVLFERQNFVARRL